MSEGNKKKSKSAPIIADMGRRSRKQIRDLKNGYGKLMDEIDDCVEELVAAGTVDKSAQTVVVLVTERPVDTVRQSLMPISPRHVIPNVEGRSERNRRGI